MINASSPNGLVYACRNSSFCIFDMEPTVVPVFLSFEGMILLTVSFIG